MKPNGTKCRLSKQKSFFRLNKSKRLLSFFRNNKQGFWMNMCVQTAMGKKLLFLSLLKGRITKFFMHTQTLLLIREARLYNKTLLYPGTVLLVQAQKLDILKKLKLKRIQNSKSWQMYVSEKPHIVCFHIAVVRMRCNKSYREYTK